MGGEQYHSGQATHRRSVCSAQQGTMILFWRTNRRSSPTGTRAHWRAHWRAHLRLRVTQRPRVPQAQRNAKRAGAHTGTGRRLLPAVVDVVDPMQYKLVSLSTSASDGQHSSVRPFHAHAHHRMRMRMRMRKRPSLRCMLSIKCSA